MARVPDFLPYPPGPVRRNPDLHRAKLVMHDFEAVAHANVRSSRQGAKHAKMLFSMGNLRFFVTEKEELGI